MSGRSRKELKGLIKSGAIIRHRPKGGKISISIPKIDEPHFVFGDNGEGIGRGPGKEGDVVGRDPPRGDGKGGAGDTPGEGITISVDMDDLLKVMEEDLKLPKMKPKPNETFEDIKIKYNNISKVGIYALRHTRRTMKEAMKRLAMSGNLDDVQMIPGAEVPIRVVTPIKSDFRYRQYREIKIPASNAVIFFARDCSGSMDDYKCDIVSDMSWWLDCWIRKFYKRVDRCYFVHDTRAEEVSEDKFYKYRFGGGTMCSSAFEAVSEQLVNRYPPDKFNVYFFYFTDGENWNDDNAKVVKIMREKLGAHVVNLIGITQVCSWYYQDSVKQFIDESIEDGEGGLHNVKTVSIGPKTEEGSKKDPFGFNPAGAGKMSEDERNEQIIGGIRELLGSEKDD